MGERTNLCLNEGTTNNTLQFKMLLFCHQTHSLSQNSGDVAFWPREDSYHSTVSSYRKTPTQPRSLCLKKTTTTATACLPCGRLANNTKVSTVVPPDNRAASLFRLFNSSFLVHHKTHFVLTRMDFNFNLVVQPCVS